MSRSEPNTRKFARPDLPGRNAAASLRGNAHTHLTALMSGLAETFADEGRDGGALAAARLGSSLQTAYRRTQSANEPGGLLTAACTLPDAHPFSQHVLSCRSLLDWTLWQGEGLATDVSSRLFTTELLGPDGHFPADDVRVGLLVSDTQTDYPVSNHSGEETYLVLAGVAEWTVGDAPYTAKPPGALIHALHRLELWPMRGVFAPISQRFSPW